MYGSQVNGLVVSEYGLEVFVSSLEILEKIMRKTISNEKLFSLETLHGILKRLIREESVPKASVIRAGLKIAKDGLRTCDEPSRAAVKGNISVSKDDPAFEYQCLEDLLLLITVKDNPFFISELSPLEALALQADDV